MLKKTITAFIILLLIATSSIWWYFRPKQAPPKLNETIRAIPVNASFIIECKKPRDLKQKLAHENKFWKALLSTDFFNTLNNEINVIDSLLLSEPKINTYTDSLTLYISAHPAGVNGYDFLFTVGVPFSINSNDIESIIKKGGREEIKKHSYDEVEISQAKLNDATLNFTVQKNILLMSFNNMLLEDAIRQLNINNSLLSNNTFARLLRSQDAISDFNVYLNLNLLPGYMEHFISNTHQHLLSSLRYFSDWIVLDGTAKNDAFTFNGFSASGDSVNNFLGLFKDQQPQHVDIFKLAPLNTAMILDFGVSNFRTYYGLYKKYLEGQHKFFDYRKIISEMEGKYHIDADKQFLEFLDKEMALLITAPATDFSSNAYAIFHTNDIDQAFTSLKITGDTIIKKQKLKRDTAMYRSYPIAHLPINNFLPELLGQSFEPVTENYFTRISNYLVFANSIEALKNLINDYEKGNTLENNSAFNSFAENISSESNILIYASVNKVSSAVKNLLADHYATEWEKALKGNLKNVDSFVLQFSSTETFFYTNACLKYNTSQKETCTPLWETLLDTTISSQPSLVLNHITNEKEILVQDDANTIYLINGEGNILWKKNLPEKIIGKIHQVDARKNNKLQLLFNTNTAIYLIDRKGNNVDNFPITLKSKATNGLNVFDFDNKKDYRIILACENNKIYNYNIKGEMVKKWDFEFTKAPVYSSLQHVSIDGKDLILAVDAKGTIYATDRHGNEQLNLKEKLNDNLKNWWLEKGNTIEETKLIACDSLGTIHLFNLAGKQEEKHLMDFETTPMFTYSFSQNDSVPEYLFVHNEQLSAFSAKGKELFNYTFKEPLTSAPQIFINNDTIVNFGITSSAATELYLLNSKGSLIKSFPCAGTTPFCISSLSEKSSPVLVCGLRNRIIAYTIPVGSEKNGNR